MIHGIRQGSMLAEQSQWMLDLIQTHPSRLSYISLLALNKEIIVPQDLALWNCMITVDICSHSVNEQGHSPLLFPISHHKGKAKLSSRQICDRKIFLYINFLTDLVSLFSIWQRDQSGMFTIAHNVCKLTSDIMLWPSTFHWWHYPGSW